MAKAKEGSYSIETSAGLFDLVEISKDPKEMDVLSLLKNDLLKEGQFAAPKQGRVCLASIGAFIIYVSSLTELLETDSKSDHIH